MSVSILGISFLERDWHINKNATCGSIGYIKDDTENGAASVIRTRDLTLTKGALYRWSYGSTVPWFTISDSGLQAADFKQKYHQIAQFIPRVSQMCQHI